MINKEQQDLSWACLPKEVRDEIKRKYKIAENDIDLFIQTLILESIFGHHNLTSDTEPEEMLYVPKWRVQQYFEGIDVCIDISDSEQLKALRTALKILFGDKCLPDKETCKENLQVEQPSVQGEPMFKVGDKVRAKGTKHIGTIKESYSNDVGYRVYFEDGDGGWDEEYSADDLEPYTEPETKNMMTTENGDLPNKEKELNLCELLKGCEGEIFYSPTFGDIKLTDIINNTLLFDCLNGVGELILLSSGKWFKNSEEISVFPSKEQRNWMEWKESRKPKRWRAENGDEYWLIDSSGELCTSQENFSIQDDNYYEFGNYFRTESEAKEMVVKIKELLLNGR